jgi:hypothetical protein
MSKRFMVYLGGDGIDDHTLADWIKVLVEKEEPILDVKLWVEESMGYTLNDLIALVHKNALAHGFWEGEDATDENARFLVHLERVHRELSEAGQLHDRFHDIRETWIEKGGKPEGIPVELADAVIRIFDMCGRYGIDLEDVILRKHAYNKTRPMRHGKRG